MAGLELSPIFKGMLVLFLSSFLPVTMLSFLMVRRTKKAAEFARVVEMLALAEDVVEFARNRVAEQYAARDFRMPVIFTWIVCLLGFVSLLFGADMVIEHQGKVNFLLTGTTLAEPETLQRLRIQNMAVMSLAFVGAFIWSSQSILYRLSAGDLSPAAYFQAGIRMILAPILSLMFSHLIHGTDSLQELQTGLPVIAFLVGWFPERSLIFLKERYSVIFRSKRSADSLPLNMIEGVHTYDRARLAELGIHDAQNLANANFVELVVRTAFNPGQIIDWIGQAQLYIYFKDEISALRKQQIRTVFDLLPLCRDAKRCEELAVAGRLNPLGVRLFCDKLADDPVVNQLLSFKKQLCFAPRKDSADQTDPQLLDMPSPIQQTSAREEVAHG